MDNIYQIKLPSIIISVSKIIDFIDLNVKNHHLRVAIIARYIAKEYNLPQDYIKEIVLASCLHDIGIFSSKIKLSLILDSEEKIEDINAHGEIGYSLLKGIPQFKKAARMIKNHHVIWEKQPYIRERFIPIGSYIIHLADRIEVFLRKIKGEPVFYKGELIEKLESLSGSVFMPELVEAFKSVSEKTSFWLDISYPAPEELVEPYLPNIILSLDELLKFSQVIRELIDYRSKFTALHSIGVSVLSNKIAELFHFSEMEKKIIAIAGYLHDVGKLAVPIEILEKNGPLTKTEWWIMQSHVYYSYRILEKIEGAKLINLWASLHHEKPNGRGYPFKLTDKDLPFGARIVAVADVFTALAEDRPYRKGLDGKKIKNILKELANNRDLDRIIIEIVFKHFDELYEYLKTIQEKEKRKYLEFKEAVNF